MSSTKFDPLNEQRKRNKNQIEPMNKLLETLVTTQKGWLLRQALKLSTVAGAWVTAQLAVLAEKSGVPITQDLTIIGAAVGTAIVAIAEVALSKAASYISAK